MTSSKYISKNGFVAQIWQCGLYCMRQDRLRKADVIVQAALSDACTASLDNLFPPQFNLSAIKRDLDNAQPGVQSVVPSPIVGFTLFLASDSALDSTNGGSSAF